MKIIWMKCKCSAPASTPRCLNQAAWLNERRKDVIIVCLKFLWFFCDLVRQKIGRSSRSKENRSFSRPKIVVEHMFKCISSRLDVPDNRKKQKISIVNQRKRALFSKRRKIQWLIFKQTIDIKAIVPKSVSNDRHSRLAIKQIWFAWLGMTIFD